MFQLGETYDVSFGGSGGSVLNNAIVVRSDAAPDGGAGGGIVVFSGTDENGDPAEVIWTPDYDLEQWYADNFNPSMEPEFFTQDQDAAYTHQIMCFRADALIKTKSGPKRAHALTSDDKIWTYSNGWSNPRAITHAIVRGASVAAPVRFPAGSIGNSSALYLSQQHRVLLTDPRLEPLFGFSRMLVPARAFAGYRGVTIEPVKAVHCVHILLDRHDILEANGALCESLLLQDVAEAALADPGAAQILLLTPEIKAAHHKTILPVLNKQEARLAFYVLWNELPAHHDDILAANNIDQSGGQSQTQPEQRAFALT